MCQKQNDESRIMLTQSRHHTEIYAIHRSTQPIKIRLTGSQTEPIGYATQ
jgi:hypothetical protein